MIRASRTAIFQNLLTSVDTSNPSSSSHQWKYHVFLSFRDPSEVRKLMGRYAEAFIEHEKNFKKNINKVHTWKATLTEVANLA
ncbi:TMV resistance protein N-like isoform X2 [Quercus lobata]|uniref:TMV resistance protein N-like isoform X2 n=1 Tax=Quercus lobata TaxID=97700 RepID=UPI001246980D|nr:TMV resistance protein N-like isoform X2 [Quercus lobata]